MAATFCLTIAKDSHSKFQSNDGEEYIMRCNKYGKCFSLYSTDHGGVINAYGEMSLEWKNPSERLIIATFYNKNLQNVNHLYEKKIFVENKAHVKIHILHNNCNMISVDIKPHVQLKKNTSDQMLIPTTGEQTTTKKLEQLSIEMGNLLHTGDLSDVILTDGSTDIRAHKLILSARSSVFAKMFQHPMKESQENRVTIKDMPIGVLKELLNFVYSGVAVIKDSKMARELYIAADKYDIGDLRDICSVMLRLIDLNSVLDTLLLADLYGDKALKGAALNFISQNYSQLKVLDNWKGFMKEHQTLAIEILSFAIDKKL